MYILGFLLPILTLTTAIPFHPLHPRDAPGSFTVRALSNPPFLNTTSTLLTASNSRLFLGAKKTSELCPEDPTIPCYDLGITAFFAHPHTVGPLEMYARVPGGQKAFINKDGSVGFTKEYKADEIPEGTIVEGWLYTPNAQNPSRLDGEVSFTGSPGGGGGKGWFACEMEEKGVWSVKIDVEGVDVSGCKSFKAVASVWTDEEAWAYN